jgi:iron complex transport system ATP-binding protein
MKHGKERQTVLELASLEVGYGRKSVIKDLSFSLGVGRFLSLLGPNGAGKTTLLRTMARLIPAMAGSISIAGRDFGSIAQAELARLQAVVLTDRLNPGLLTSYEVVALGRHPHTGFFGKLGAADHRAIERAIGMVGAVDLAGRYFERLSDGEKQKVILARALAQEPRLILLDEPTVHLDLKHRLEVMSILRGLCREMNVAVVASLHDIDVASRVSDQVALISGGGLEAFGPPEVILDDLAVSKLYNLNGAHYDSRLGVIELKGGKRRGPVFVLPGGGAAASALRLLHKRDYAIICGVAHEGDIDTHIAVALGAELVTAPSFGQASAESLQKCREMMTRAEVVIDSGFNVGPANQANAELLAEAAQMGKAIFSLRPPETIKSAEDPQFPEIVYCADEMDLAARLSVHFHKNAASS